MNAYPELLRMKLGLKQVSVSPIITIAPTENPDFKQQSRKRKKVSEEEEKEVRESIADDESEHAHKDSEMSTLYHTFNYKQARDLMGLGSNADSNARNSYPKRIVKILMKWLKDHIYYPYPSEDERIDLCEKTGLSRKQLRIWLINARKVS